MDITKAQKASELLKEIGELSEFRNLITDRQNGKVAHFEFCQHYGIEPRRVVFDHRYTQRFLAVTQQIIDELKSELEAI